MNFIIHFQSFFKGARRSCFWNRQIPRKEIPVQIIRQNRMVDQVKC